MSVDWEKYSTAEECWQRARKPAENGVLGLVAGGVRAIEGLTVEHSPDRENNNRAHSNVWGLPDEESEVRLRQREELFELFRGWEIEPSTP
jgi:hypothetical protein